jgi:hypothetical protein
MLPWYLCKMLLMFSVQVLAAILVEYSQYSCTVHDSTSNVVITGFCFPLNR